MQSDLIFDRNFAIACGKKSGTFIEGEHGDVSLLDGGVQIRGGCSRFLTVGAWTTTPSAPAKEASQYFLESRPPLLSRSSLCKRKRPISYYRRCLPKAGKHKRRLATYAEAYFRGNRFGRQELCSAYRGRPKQERAIEFYKYAGRACAIVSRSHRAVPAGRVGKDHHGV